MRVEIGGRQTGKTTRMIEWLRHNKHGILIVHNEREAQRLRDLYDPGGTMEMANRIVAADVRPNHRRSFYRPQVAIDNVDLILRGLFGDVRLVTFTEKAHDHPDHDHSGEGPPCCNEWG